MIYNPLTAPQISDKCFEPLLTLFFNCSDCFSLTLSKFHLLKSDAQIALSPFQIGSFATIDWFCYHTTEENPLTILIYKTDEAAKNILLKYYQNLFLNTSDKTDISNRQNLEDLCFFSNGKLILGTVSHEYICHIYPPSGEIKQRIEAIYDKWEMRETNSMIDLHMYM